MGNLRFYPFMNQESEDFGLSIDAKNELSACLKILQEEHCKLVNTISAIEQLLGAREVEGG